MTDQEKAYVIQNKYFLALQNKIARYKIAGLNPPDYLQQRFEVAKRRLRILSKALNKS